MTTSPSERRLYDTAAATGESDGRNDAPTATDAAPTAGSAPETPETPTRRLMLDLYTPSPSVSKRPSAASSPSSSSLETTDQAEVAGATGETTASLSDSVTRTRHGDANEAATLEEPRPVAPLAVPSAFPTLDVAHNVLTTDTTYRLVEQRFVSVPTMLVPVGMPLSSVPIGSPFMVVYVSLPPFAVASDVSAAAASAAQAAARVFAERSELSAPAGTDVSEPRVTAAGTEVQAQLAPSSSSSSLVPASTLPSSPMTAGPLIRGTSLAPYTPSPSSVASNATSLSPGSLLAYASAKMKQIDQDDPSNSPLTPISIGGTVPTPEMSPGTLIVVATEIMEALDRDESDRSPSMPLTILEAPSGTTTTAPDPSSTSETAATTHLSTPTPGPPSAPASALATSPLGSASAASTPMMTPTETPAPLDAATPTSNPPPTQTPELIEGVPSAAVSANADATTMVTKKKPMTTAERHVENRRRRALKKAQKRNEDIPAEDGEVAAPVADKIQPKTKTVEENIPAECGELAAPVADKIQKIKTVVPSPAVGVNASTTNTASPTAANVAGKAIDTRHLGVRGIKNDDDSKRRRLA